MIDKEQILTNMKLITEEENEALLNLMITKAEKSIMNYFTDAYVTLPDNFANGLEDLAIYKYRCIGTENLKAESSKFGASTYTDDIPASIKRELSQCRGMVIH